LPVVNGVVVEIVRAVVVGVVKFVGVVARLFGGVAIVVVFIGIRLSCGSCGRGSFLCYLRIDMLESSIYSSY
jgi:hypothetical protein